LVDGTQDDIEEAYTTIMGELEQYGGDLINKPQILGLNKCDALTDDEIAEKRKILEDISGVPVFVLSGVTGDGVPDVLGALWNIIQVDKAARQAEETPEGAPQAEDIDSSDTSGGWSPL